MSTGSRLEIHQENLANSVRWDHRNCQTKLKNFLQFDKPKVRENFLRCRSNHLQIFVHGLWNSNSSIKTAGKMTKQKKIIYFQKDTHVTKAFSSRQRANEIKIESMCETKAKVIVAIMQLLLANWCQTILLFFCSVDTQEKFNQPLN